MTKYTSDVRFQVIHWDPSPYWILQVNDAQISDNGIYECQISTEPKISRRYNLTVLGK